jgi:hypothetical protein
MEVDDYSDSSSAEEESNITGWHIELKLQDFSK